MPIILVLLGVIGLSACEKKNTDNLDKGRLEISLNLPDETSSSKSGAFTDSSGVVSYHLMISIEDMEGNNIMSDSLIPLYTFGTDFISEKVVLKTGECRLTKFMVINPSGEVVFAAPVEGSPLAYLVNRPLPITFYIFPNQVTRIVPEVLAIGDQTPDQFGYANFGMQIIMPLHFWAICILDNPLSMAPGLQLTTAKLTIYVENGWHYTFNLEPATNHLIIRGGSPVYYFLLEKEGYMPQKMEFTENELMATSKDNPVILKIPCGSTTLSFEALYSLSTPTVDGQINASEWSNANIYSIIFTRPDGAETKAGKLLLQHDGTWLYIGVNTETKAGWDVYLSLKFDGNHDHELSGSSSEPHTDINVEYPSPEGWNGYIRYDYLVASNTYPVTAPTGTQRKSYGSLAVSYEYKIKLSDLNTSTGQTIGFYMFNYTYPIAGVGLVYEYSLANHGYEFPINLVINDPSKWADIKLK